MRRNQIAACVLLGVATLSLGCKVNTVERRESEARPSTVDTRKFSPDSIFADDLKLVRLNEATLPDGSRKIQAEVRNTTGHTLRFNCRVEWFDGAGMLIETPSQGWRPYITHGGESVMITSVAPSPRAADFRIKLIRAEDRD